MSSDAITLLIMLPLIFAFCKWCDHKSEQEAYKRTQRDPLCCCHDSSNYICEYCAGDSND